MIYIRNFKINESTNSAIKNHLESILEFHIEGGVADSYTAADIAKKHQVPVEDILKQLEIGIEIEMEHTDNRQAAKDIALDHLYEIKDYYSRLQQMEQDADDEFASEEE